MALDGLRSGLWTSMPGIIQSFNAGAVTATVQLAIKGIVHAPDGSAQFVNMPLLVDVPVHFPRGGGCTLTFPVAKGDECLVVFAARCIDGWWQSGGVQAPIDPRIHDLSDGFAFVGFFSQATKIGGISTSTAQLRSNDGSTYVEVDPAGKVVNCVAPNGMTLTTPSVTVTGTIAVKNAGGASTACAINGKTQFTGQVFANGHRIDETHTHNGVQPGSGNTGAVN
uniref:Phage protein Gp138 N-terminal domain-containing protein n=1 Tax=Ralstonia pickettii (strain 12D) TaxID=428406 RepID=C6BBR5_RALP1